jgi:hypothetical protein
MSNRTLVFYGSYRSDPRGIKQRVVGSSPTQPIGDKLAKFLGFDFGRDADFGRRRAKVTT